MESILLGAIQNDVIASPHVTTQVTNLSSKR